MMPRIMFSYQANPSDQTERFDFEVSELEGHSDFVAVIEPHLLRRARAIAHMKRFPHGLEWVNDDGKLIAMPVGFTFEPDREFYIKEYADDKRVPATLIKNIDSYTSET